MTQMLVNVYVGFHLIQLQQSVLKSLQSLPLKGSEPFKRFVVTVVLTTKFQSLMDKTAI